jgi:hypothetical protein
MSANISEKVTQNSIIYRIISDRRGRGGEGLIVEKTGDIKPGIFM